MQIKVLVIDDRAGMAGILAEALTRSGRCISLCATHGQQGLEILKTNPFDVVVMRRHCVLSTSMSTPEFNRLANQAHPGLFFLLIVEEDVPCLLPFFPSGRVDAYLSEPFSSTDLEQTIQYLMKFQQSWP